MGAERAVQTWRLTHRVDDHPRQCLLLPDLLPGWVEKVLFRPGLAGLRRVAEIMSKCNRTSPSTTLAMTRAVDSAEARHVPVFGGDFLIGLEKPGLD